MGPKEPTRGVNSSSSRGPSSAHTKQGVSPQSQPFWLNEEIPSHQPQSAEHHGETCREAASWPPLTAAHKTLLASQELCVIADLGYRASRSVFRKIVVDLCHRSFDRIHHLKDRNRNNSGDHLPEAFQEDIHLKST